MQGAGGAASQASGAELVGAVGVAVAYGDTGQLGGVERTAGQAGGEASSERGRQRAHRAWRLSGIGAAVGAGLGGSRGGAAQHSRSGSANPSSLTVTCDALRAFPAASEIPHVGNRTSAKVGSRGAAADLEAVSHRKHEVLGLR